MRKTELFKRIEMLLEYGFYHKLFLEEDRTYIRNKILEILKIEDYVIKTYTFDISKIKYVTEIIDDIIDYAVKKKIIKNLYYQRENIKAKLMDCLLPLPSTVNDNFRKDYKKLGSSKSFLNFYNFSKASNYIQTDKIDKNIHYISKSKYGDIEISINLSKPEKDPKEIAMLKKMKIKNLYPLTPLAKENEGFFGTLKKDPRQNHRVINLKVNKEKWHFQYSPYIYYNEHSILFSDEIRDMKIDKKCFTNLLSFIDIVPEYFIGSNADLPIVGGSILNHDHYQCGRHEFPMEKANIRKVIKFDKYSDIEAGIVNWPLSVIRLRAKKTDKSKLLNLANDILNSWRKYNDKENDIYSFTTENHNTITPIARFKNGRYELDLVLRNNRTSKEKPYGIFHPSEEYHNIKKENIGLIEVMGLAILPARLKKEMEEINQILRSTLNLETAISFMHENDDIRKHIKFLEKYFDREFMEDDYMDSLYQYIGKVYEKILEDCGVFKNTKVGNKGFDRFIATVNSM